MMGTETDDIINELFESFLKKYREGLETKIEGNNFVFESVDLFYYSLHKISLNRGGSYIDSPDEIKNKKAGINPQNEDNECLKYAITVALNHEKIEKKPQRISKISLLLIIIIEKTLSFYHTQKIGKNLNKTIRQLLLISYLYNTTLNK